MSWESKYFSKEEMTCKCGCGQEAMNIEFMGMLDDLREYYGKPMIVTSGYRCPEHPVEARKKRRGAHTYGRAVDIAVSGSETHDFLKHVFEQDKFHRIGVAQKGEGRFIHLDNMIGAEGFPTPWVYSY